MKRFLLLSFILVISQICKAQIMINEGKIIYDVFITTNLIEQKGQLIITLKNNWMKREMKMNNGFTNTILFDAQSGESTVYNDNNGNKFSKKISKEDVKIQNIKFANAKYISNNESKMIDNKKCKSVDITYTDGSKNVVFFDENYRVGITEFYSMFSELKGLPMQYEVTTNTNKILLVANSVLQTPIDAVEIDAPTGYKMLKK
jgi:hypothetical protein